MQTVAFPISRICSMFYTVEKTSSEKGEPVRTAHLAQRRIKEFRFEFRFTRAAGTNQEEWSRNWGKIGEHVLDLQKVTDGEQR